MRGTASGHSDVTSVVYVPLRSRRLHRNDYAANSPAMILRETDPRGGWEGEKWKRCYRSRWVRSGFGDEDEAEPRR